MSNAAWRSLCFLLVGGAVGCGAPGQDGSVFLQDDPISQGISSTNGLRAVNGLRATNGLVATNGLRTTNGLSTINGLRTTNGLVSNEGLMTTDAGRATVDYMARCALANGDYLDKQDNNGVWRRYYGRMGVGTSWKDGSCDESCQQRISACMLAHMNSTGANVPIFINGDPNKMPSVGVSMPHDSGSDAAIMEGVFFGNMLAANPPLAYFVQGDGFKASIPGRLGASSDNPYKAWSGYRPDDNKFYDGVASGLCMGKTMSDGEHFDYTECGKSDAPYGTWRGTWPNVLTTYVNANYNGKVSQDWVQRTLNFDAEATGLRTQSRADVWTTHHNMEFKNTVWNFATGRTHILDVNGGRRFCSGNWGEHIVITKNSGEPFSLVNLKVGYYGENSTLTIKGYSKGSSTVKTVSVPNPSRNGTHVNLNWDGLIKVEIRGPQGNCIDDVVIKT